MPQEAEAPNFMVYALKDPIGGNLDRIQIIKGWLNANGETEEKVLMSCGQATGYQIIAALVEKPLENGYSEEDCGKFLGANMYRVMKQFWV